MSGSGKREPIKSPPRRGHLQVATVAFFMLAVYGSLVPLRYQPIAWDEAIQRFRNVPYLQLSVAGRADWVSNILLFIPLGFLCLGAIAVDQRRDILSIMKAALVVICCSLASIGIEFTQLWFPPRTVSQNDIIAESIGGLVGVMVWLLAGQTLVDWLRQYTAKYQQKRQIDWLLEAYLVGFLLYHVLPLDLTISFGELWEKVRLGRVTLVPFSDLQLNYLGFYGLFRDVVTCVPLGALASVWRLPTGRVRSWPNALVFGSLIVIGVEFAQLIVFSRFSSITDVLLGVAGVACGISLTRRMLRDHLPTTGEFRRDDSRRIAAPMVLGLVYSCFLVAVFCAPFDVTRDKAHIRQAYEGFFAVPFARIYAGSEFNAISSSLANILLFAPLGCLAAVAAMAISKRRVHRQIILVGAWLLTVMLALGVEMLQIFLPTHFADVTEVILRSVGSALGIAITCRLVSRNQTLRD